MKINQQVKAILIEIQMEVNKRYGYHEGIPRINYGPCGVFAQIFYTKWNKLFNQKVHICFVIDRAKDECEHIVIRLPSGELYDGGIGIHTENEYKSQFSIEDMVNYDEKLLDKWSYGLDRTYPRFCSNFNRKEVEDIVSTKLEHLFNLIGQDITTP